MKFAILDDAARFAAAEQLARLGQRYAVLPVAIDAGQTRVHLMQEVFFAIARALPWTSLIQGYLERLFAANEYTWPRPGEAMTTAFTP